MRFVFLSEAAFNEQTVIGGFQVFFKCVEREDSVILRINQAGFSCYDAGSVIYPVKNEYTSLS